MANLKKSSQGYGYKYTDLAQINIYCEENGITYYQETETVVLPNEAVDYIITYVNYGDGEWHKRRGCKVAEATLQGIKNPAQEQGSAITYARRYSLLMALGLATTDDDAACLSVDPKAEEKQEKAIANKIATLATMKGCEEQKIKDHLADLKLATLDAQELQLDKWLAAENKKKEPEPPKEYKRK